MNEWYIYYIALETRSARKLSISMSFREKGPSCGGGCWMLMVHPVHPCIVTEVVRSWLLNLNVLRLAVLIDVSRSRDVGLAASTASCCLLVVRLYILRSAKERWPVRSCMIFRALLHGTTALLQSHANCDWFCIPRFLLLGTSS